MTVKSQVRIIRVLCFRRLLHVILNNKFRSFQVRRLIQKDNTDNKVLERNFIQKKQERKDGKDKALQILVKFARLIWERVSGKQSSLNLSIFCASVEKFQLLFNSVESAVKLSFSRILGLNFLSFV